MAGDVPIKREIQNMPPLARENSWSPHDAGQPSRGDSSGLSLKKILGAGVVTASGLLGGAEAATLKPEAPGAGAYLAQSTEAVNSKYGRGAGEASILGLGEKALTTPEVPTPPTATPDRVTVTEYVTVTHEVNKDCPPKLDFGSAVLGVGITAFVASTGTLMYATAAKSRRERIELDNRVRDRGSSEIELRQQEQRAADNQGRGTQTERRSFDTLLGEGSVDQ